MVSSSRPGELGEPLKKGAICASMSANSCRRWSDQKRSLESRRTRTRRTFATISNLASNRINAASTSLSALGSRLVALLELGASLEAIDGENEASEGAFEADDERLWSEGRRMGEEEAGPFR